MVLKEETKVLHKIEEKDHNFITGEKSISCLRTGKTSSQKELKRQKLKLSPANNVGKVLTEKETLITT